MISFAFRTLLVCALIFPVNFLQAQTILKKADKQFELYAFNLAVESYLRAEEAGELDGNACGRLADSYRHLNKLEKAAEWYARTVDNKQAEPVHLLNFGKVLLSLGKFDQAEELFTRYAVAEPIKGNHYIEVCDFAKKHHMDAPAYRTELCSIDSPSSDFGPAIRNNELVYASSRVDIRNSSRSTTWTGQASNRLFRVSINGKSELSEPELLHSDIRNAFNEGPVSFSPDGKTVAITKNNFTDGTRQIPSSGSQMSIFFAETDGHGDWTSPKPFTYNTPGYSTAYPAFSADGNALYFASDRPGGFGGYDIYISYRFEETWTAPENLGPVVNTAGNEITPFPDGSTLYFASDWHPGFGGLDLFKAEKSGTDFKSVYHLGTGVNSGYDDYGLVLGPQLGIGFFTTNRPNGKGLEDIFRLEELGKELVVRVIDASSGKPLKGVTLELTNCKEASLLTNDGGEIHIRVFDHFDCVGKVMMDGYRKVELRLKNNEELQEQVFDVALLPEGTLLEGRIVTGKGQEGLHDVLIEAIGPDDQHSLTAKSRKNGSFVLGLEPSSTYEIRYSKAGYIEEIQVIKTGAEHQKIIKTIDLSPAGILASDTEGLSGPIAMEEVLTAKGAATEESPESERSGRIPAGSGFSVQLLSVDHVRIAKVREIREQLSGIGNIYVTQDGNYQKVRVGIYPTRESALRAQEKIRTMGYTGTFIVEDQGVLLKEEELSLPEKDQEEVNSDLPAEGYKVRLATYSDPKWFDGSKLLDAGIIEKRIKGEFTIMLLGGYSNLVDAKRGLERAKQAGFSEAHLVREVDGELKKIVE